MCATWNRPPQRATREPPRRWRFLFTRLRRPLALTPPPWAASTPWPSPAALARTPPRCAPLVATASSFWASRSTRNRTPAAAAIASFRTIYRGVKIGHNFFAHTHVVVREFCRIGDNVLLQNAVIIGSDGFGFAKEDSGRWHKIVQSGNVEIANDVEIQAGTCIDRANVGRTYIARGAKIDNLVHIGHACTIGEDTLLCAQVGLAGTTDVGNNVILAGQVGVSGHVKIGDGAVVIAQSGVPQDVAPGAMVSGAPAIDHKLWLRCCAVYPKLPEIAKAVRKLSERE